MMRSVPLLLRLFIACAAMLVLTSCSGQSVTRILFIGNSYTFINDGIDAHLVKLKSSVRPERVVGGGYTLQKHWETGTALRNIRSGGWAYVVLQEQSQTPVFDPAKFRQFVREFDREIKLKGAKTVLLMTWERPDSVKSGVTTANLAAAARAAGAELGIKVAPVGLAFEQSLRERPDLALYVADGHPTLYGTFLASCVLFGTIFDRSPVGITQADTRIPPDLRDYFERVAARTLGY